MEDPHEKSLLDSLRCLHVTEGDRSQSSTTSPAAHEAMVGRVVASGEADEQATPTLAHQSIADLATPVIRNATSHAVSSPSAAEDGVPQSQAQNKAGSTLLHRWLEINGRAFTPGEDSDGSEESDTSDATLSRANVAVGRDSSHLDRFSVSTPLNDFSSDGWSMVDGRVRRKSTTSGFGGQFPASTPHSGSVRPTESLTSGVDEMSVVTSLDEASSVVNDFFAGEAAYENSGRSKLRLWQSFCLELGLVGKPEALPGTITGCQKLLKARAHVNLVDYRALKRDPMATPDQLRQLVFPNNGALMRYTRNTGKFVPLKKAKSEYLQPLLKTFR